jgi:hypothetical protein
MPTGFAKHSISVETLERGGANGVTTLSGLNNLAICVPSESIGARRPGV